MYSRSIYQSDLSTVRSLLCSTVYAFHPALGKSILSSSARNFKDSLRNDDHGPSPPLGTTSSNTVTPAG